MQSSDFVRSQRVGRGWAWSEEEEELLRSGHYQVPGRSRNACMKKRRKLKLFLRSRRRCGLYQPPQVPEAGQIPWPKWWRRAHSMKLAGYTLTEIARLLGRGRTAVEAALYHEVRTRRSLAIKRWRQPFLSDPEWRRRNYARDAMQDHGRLKARSYAREQWRAAGGKPEALEGFYRKYECL